MAIKTYAFKLPEDWHGMLGALASDAGMTRTGWLYNAVYYAYAGCVRRGEYPPLAEPPEKRPKRGRPRSEAYYDYVSPFGGRPRKGERIHPCDALATGQPGDAADVTSMNPILMRMLGSPAALYQPRIAELEQEVRSLRDRLAHDCANELNDMRHDLTVMQVERDRYLAKLRQHGLEPRDDTPSDPSTAPLPIRRRAQH